MLAPHPDDECLAAAGFLQRALRAGAEARVAFATDGENAPWIQRAFEKRWRIGPRERERFGRLRREEALQALAELGLPAEAIRFLHWPDQGLTPLLLGGGEAPVGQLHALLEESRPTLLLAPSRRDLHPDHSALAVLLDLACARLDPAGRPRRLEFLIHRQRAREAPGLSSLQLTAEESAGKRRALSRYRSQLSAHRRRMFAFQSRAEEFTPVPEPQPGSAGHAVAAASWEAGELRLRIELPSGLGARGVAELLLLGARAGRDASCARVALPRAAGWRPRCELRLSAESLPPGTSLHAKVARARGFFDQSGWIELPRPSPDPESQPGIRATHSISTRASLGSLATCTVERAGLWGAKKAP